MFDEDSAILMGTGIVGWPVAERESGRYGYIALYPNMDPKAKALYFKRLEYEVGTLGAVVIHTRKKESSGDLKRGFIPTIPEVGSKFILGKGILWSPGYVKFKSKGDPRCLGLKPIINELQPKDWLDPKVLYKIVNQTCKIYFIPDMGL